MMHRRGKAFGWDWGGPWAWPGFGPGPGRGGFFRGGEVRLALLSLLSDGPAHGYELMKRLESRSGGMYQASAGTVYPVLQQLEDEGLVVSDTQDGKKVYRITDAGRAELAGQSEAVDAIWRRARGWEEWGSWVGPESMEIAAGVGRLVKSAFRAARGGHERAERVREILDRVRRELDELANV